MKKAILSVAAMLVMALMLVSCGGGGPKANAEKFLNGFVHMDYAAAKEVSTEETKKQLDTYESIMSNMMQPNAKEAAKKLKVDVKEPVVNGDKATVEYTITGDSAPKTLNMVKQNGKWLAEWTKMEAGGMGGTETPSMEPMPSTMDTSIAPTTDGTMNAAPADTATAQ
jgi:uncharacterized protein YxeA